MQVFVRKLENIFVELPEGASVSELKALVAGLLKLQTEDR